MRARCTGTDRRPLHKRQFDFPGFVCNWEKDMCKMVSMLGGLGRAGKDWGVVSAHTVRRAERYGITRQNMDIALTNVGDDVPREREKDGDALQC